jgi:hypothetical protein
MNPNREAATMQEADDGPGRRRPQAAEHHRDMGANDAECRAAWEFYVELITSTLACPYRRTDGS